MKTKLFVLCVTAFLGLNNITAQECTKNLSLFNDSAKAGIYQDALPRYEKLIKECPDFNIVLYKRADKMFGELVDKAQKNGDKSKQKEYAQMMIDNIKLRMKHFTNETPFGKYNAEIGKIMYENDLGSLDEQFNYFEESWNKDSDNFHSPKGLYIYFLLYDKQVDAGKKSINDLFVKYDQIINQIERMENEQAVVAKDILDKKQNGEQLTAKEKRKEKNAEIYLKNYDLIKKGINKVLGDKADCDNLIPMYNKNFEEKKTDINWLRIASSRMNAKDCTSDPLFFKLVEALHDIEPSAKTALYLGKLAMQNGDANKALEYYKNAAELEKEPLDKAKAYFSIAEVYKKRGAFSSARNYYNLALNNKPSMGIAYLRIADMIASSANNCGNTTFEKRAVYWKVADYARRAASVDASLKSHATETANSYEQRAPSKSDIFQEGMQGKTVTFSCWVGGSVKVPNL
ncbi:M48 family metallopeptidase [Flavobacterium sp. CS20]|uniref:tetratricopeptide repeat protein n=1 Tax=Flavobacterium sp. CS20 TaxID=2775246 RepID=UPI001B3A4002|nr:tetratricopeptide repeat protein [Flavobacterium sp. CS20]QTY26372.1 tetratricopeptide repeat protein [Flavobacterium sp. CS20]